MRGLVFLEKTAREEGLVIFWTPPPMSDRAIRSYACKP